MSKLRFNLTLETAAPMDAATIRLRRLLKIMLRSFDFRCVSIAQSPSGARFDDETTRNTAGKESPRRIAPVANQGGKGCEQ